MAKLGRQEIRSLARSLVAASPGGIRWSALLAEISRQHPETSPNTIQGSVLNLDTLFPGEIAKPERGLYAPADDGSGGTGSTRPIPLGGAVKEADFYGPFAEWLKNDLGEVNTAIPLGGAALKSKWGTPDVVGTYKPLASHLIKFPVEIVSAEIKTDPQAPVVAFGQAVAYRLFSTKTYIAMPTTLTEEDQGRLESLCMLFGVGFVLFDLKKDAPNFSIRMRAQRFYPDMFYVNEFARRLSQYNAKLFEDLFG